MKRLRFLLATAMASSAVIAGACSTFSGTDEEPLPSGTDASTETDGAGFDAPLPPDGGPDATPPACSASAPIFEDDFASGGTSKWTVDTSSCTTGGASVDGGAASLACTSVSADAYSILLANTPLPIKRRMQVDFSFEIGTKLAHTFAQLVALFGVSGENLRFVYTAGGVQVQRSTGNKATLTTFSAVSTGTAHTMSLEFVAKDPLATTFDVRAKLDAEEKTFSMQRELDGAAPAVGVQLGVFLTETTGTFANTYDDVRVWSCD